MKHLPWFRKNRHLDLLRLIAPAREMPMEKWLRFVRRTHKDYRDFFEAAALFHFGYVATTTQANQGRAAGQLGDDVDDTAQILCQFTLTEGENFQTDPYLHPRERWDPTGFRVFVTERGIEKLSEVENQGIDRRIVVLGTLLGALVGAVATSYTQNVF